MFFPKFFSFGASLGDFNCPGGTCTATGNRCIAIHYCDSIDSNRHCINDWPEVVKANGGTVTRNSQQLANSSFKYVQIDVLTGASGSCDNGHTNANTSTLVGHSISSPECVTPPTPPNPPSNCPSGSEIRFDDGAVDNWQTGSQISGKNLSSTTININCIKANINNSGSAMNGAEIVITGPNGFSANQTVLPEDRATDSANLIISISLIFYIRL